MRKTTKIFFFLLILFIPLNLFAEAETEDDEEEQSLFYLLNFNNRFEIKRNYLNSDKPDKLSFSENSTGYYLYAGASIIWFATENTEFDMTLNSGTVKLKNLYYENQETDTYINDINASDYALKSLFIDEIYIENDSLIKLKLGKININNATDFVFNDYVFAIRGDIPLYSASRKELSLGLQYNTLSGYFDSEYKKSPFAMLDITYKNRKKFKISLFSSFLYDNDNAAGMLYKPFVEEFIAKRIIGAGIDITNICGGDLSECIRVDSSGYLLWNGIDMNLKLGNLSLSLDLILNYGRMNIDPYIVVGDKIIDIYNRRQKMSGALYQYLKFGDGVMQDTYSGGTQTDSTGMLKKDLSTRQILGFAAFLEASYRFFDLMKVSPYFLYMSGENDLEKSGYLNSFISVKSYITLSNIFFSGGLNETASSRNFAMAGINGYGVINPGLRLELKKDNSPFFLSAGIMKFYSSIKNNLNKRDYGTEMDLVSSYDILKFLQLSFEVDYFIAGNFFDKYSSTGTIKNPIKILFGLNIFFDNMD